MQTFRKNMRKFRAHFCHMVEEKITRPYLVLKEYIRFLVNKIYYKKAYVADSGNVPPEGTPMLIVSDHQNSLMDALGILLSINDRKVHFIARADVFNIHPLATRFLYWIGLLPAFRLAFEGEEGLSNNDETFRVSEQNLLDGRTVVIYPEAGHQDKHWLGRFSYGYTRMAFQAAELGNFETDIVILPACNHYSEYCALRSQGYTRYGTPIHLQPFYELYKVKPRTAQREVNALVREQIKNMMLNVEDVGNYRAIDYLRESVPGRDAARKAGLDPENLEQKLQSDKDFVRRLDEAGLPYDDVNTLLDGMEKLEVRDEDFDRKPSMTEIVLRCVCLLLFLPAAFLAAWPSLLCWIIPEYFTRKVGDKMLRASFLVALNVLFILPICGLITLIATWIRKNFLSAIIYASLLPFICCFEWYYWKLLKSTVSVIKYYKAEKAGQIAPLKELRRKVHSVFSQI